MKITEQVWQFSEPIVREQGCTLWDVEYVREGGEWFLRLYIDKEGGVDINACGAEGIPCAQHFEDADTGVDCIVDFSHHTCVGGLLDFAVKNGIPAVIATTGHTDEERQAIEAAAKKIPVFYAANYSLGIALLIELAKKVAKTMPDAEIEIIEKHHDQKLDAPSGTALAIADAICSVRPDATKKCG